MRDGDQFDWLDASDRNRLTLLGDAATTTSHVHQANDPIGTRVLIAIAAPAWLGLTAALVLARSFACPSTARPALVLHRRVGFAGRALWVPKVPTMVVPQNRSTLGGFVALASGPPVEGEIPTRLDAWLRRSGLDELPQLALIVTGRMRLVGPRPVTPSELAEMREAGSVAIDQIAPGLLGVWQLLDRDAYTLAQRRELDQWMLDRWSPGLRRRILTTGLLQAVRRITRRA